MGRIKLTVAAVFVLAFGVVGCSASGGEQTNQTEDTGDTGDTSDAGFGYSCERNETSIDFDEESTAGATAEETFETIEIEGESSVEWVDDTETELSWSLDDDIDEVTLVEWLPSSNTDCALPILEVETDLTLETDDERLDEEWRVELKLHNEELAEVDGASVELDEIDGDLDVEELEPEADSLRLFAEFTADGKEGTLSASIPTGEHSSTTEKLAEWSP